MISKQKNIRGEIMEKTWGISLEDRKMLYAPWATDKAGSYRPPRDVDAHRHYTVSDRRSMNLFFISRRPEAIPPR
jgi:hypothetical protein